MKLRKPSYSDKLYQENTEYQHYRTTALRVEQGSGMPRILQLLQTFRMFALLLLLWILLVLRALSSKSRQV